MVVVDSSALIPLLKIGLINLLFECFERVVVPEVVWEEVVIEGKKLGKDFAAVEENAARFTRVKINTDNLPRINGLHENDLIVLATAKSENDILLTNDATIYNATASENLDAWWLSIFVIHAVKTRKISPKDGRGIMLELVNAGAYLKSGILAQALLTLEKLGKNNKDNKGD